MTDVTLTEQDACPWLGLGFWPCHAVPPTARNQPQRPWAPNSLLQTAADNVLPHWEAAQLKPPLSGKHFDSKTRGRGRTSAGRCCLWLRLDAAQTSCCASLGKTGRKLRDLPKSAQVSVTCTEQTWKPVSVPTVSKLKPA